MSKISKEAYKVYGQVYKIWKDATGNASVGYINYGKNPADFKLAKRFIRENWYMQMGCKFPYDFKEVKGNRRSWIRNGYFNINGDKGWQNLNHAIGHLIAFRKYPKLRPHSCENAWVEVRGANLVVDKYLPLNTKLK